MLDHNYQLYSCGPNDTFAHAKRELGQIFYSLPFLDDITSAIIQIREKMQVEQFSAVHIRRMHLHANTTMSVNRFFTHISDNSAEALIANILEEGKKVYLSSDSYALAKRIKDKFGLNICLQDDIIDLSTYNNVQQALLGIVLLASAKQIFGSKSAYSIIASIIGNIPWINSHEILAFKKELNGDQTGAIHLIASRQFVRESYEPAYILMSTKRYAGSFTKSLNALVARFASQRVASFSTDWGHYIYQLQQLATNLLPDIMPSSIVSVISVALANKIPLSLLDSFECTYPSLYALKHILLGDSGIHSVDNYEKAIRLCVSIGVNPRGIWLRLCDYHLSDSNQELADSCANCALLLDAEYADTYYILGYIADFRCDPKAISYASKACQLEPDNAEYFYQLSCFHLKACHYSEAREYAQIAASIEPAAAKYLNHLDTFGNG